MKYGLRRYMWMPKLTRDGLVMANYMCQLNEATEYQDI